MSACSASPTAKAHGAEATTPGFVFPFMEKTMTRTTPRRRPSDAAFPTQAIYLPHSSWTRAERKPAANQTIVPTDFWARLGI